jgi:hypothetical protein
LTLASAQPSPYRIVGDANNVYWTVWGTTAANFDDGAVMGVLKKGGMPFVVAQGQPEPQDIAIDQHMLYWTNYGTDLPGSVMQADVSQSVPVPVLFASQQYAGGIAVDGTSVYWTVDSLSPPGSVWAADRFDAGGQRQLATNLTFPQGLVVDVLAGFLYWANAYTPGSVESVGIDGGGAASTSSGEGPINVAFDATSICWADSQPLDMGSVNCLPKGGTTVTPVAILQQNPTYVALDNGYVYWSDRSGGRIWRAAKDGSGLPLRLADMQAMPQGLWVDSAYVYWVNAGTTGVSDGSVMRVPK